MFNFLKREEIFEEVRLVIDSIKNNPDEWEVDINPTEAFNQKRKLKVHVIEHIGSINPFVNKKNQSPSLLLNKRETDILHKVIRKLYEKRVAEENEKEFKEARQAIREALQ